MTVGARQSKPPSDDAWTVQRILNWTTQHLRKHGSETPRLDSEILLAHARDCQRIELYTRFDQLLTDVERAEMRDLVRRRAQAEPVAYLVGFREFFGLGFEVNHDVLIPRPDTETLVMECLEVLKGASSSRVLEIGTGSGCIAVALAVNQPQSQVVAVDISESALQVAHRNAATHGVDDRIRFLCGDLLAELDETAQFDVIVSNPPYIAEADFEGLQPEVRMHEPHLALSGGPDGLDVVRRMLVEAPAHLAERGQMMFEISPEQAEAVVELAERHSCYTDVRVMNDLAGHARVVAMSKVTRSSEDDFEKT